jgi:uncharacterized membrane protein YccF (DUF307 family)
VVLSLVLPIVDKIFFSRDSDWKYLPLNIAYLMIGGLPTSLIWIIAGGSGKWLFGESDFGRYHHEGIFYQLAPFGKTFEDGPMVQDFYNSFEGLRYVYTFPIIVIWAVLTLVHSMVHLAFGVILTVSIVFIPLAYIHWKCFYYFRLRRLVFGIPYNGVTNFSQASTQNAQNNFTTPPSAGGYLGSPVHPNAPPPKYGEDQYLAL